MSIDPSTTPVSLPISDDEVEHAVILIHGIRTLAPWQKVLRSVLGQSGIPVIFTNYGYFDLLRFLLPVRYWRQAAIEQVWKSIRQVKKSYPSAKLSFVAHSFGTFILAHILKREFDFKAHRVIFCGSVVSHNFPFYQFSERFSKIVNEIGTRDFYPALAQSVSWGYGSAGSLGFRNNPKIFDRWHNGFAHSDFLTEDFCAKYWVPFLLNGQIVDADTDGQQPSRLIQFLNRFSLKYLALFLIIVFLFPWPGLPKFAPMTLTYGTTKVVGHAYWSSYLTQLDEKLTREDGGETSVLSIDGDIYKEPRTKFIVWIVPNPTPFLEQMMPKFRPFSAPTDKRIPIKGAHILHVYFKSDLGTGPISELIDIRARNAGIADRKLIIEKSMNEKESNYKFDENEATRFLIGLSAGQEDMKLNEQNLKNADELVFSFKYSDGKIGSIIVGKNEKDKSNIDKALKSWTNAFQM